MVEPLLSVAEVCEVVGEHGHLEDELQRCRGVLVAGEPSHDRDEPGHGPELMYCCGAVCWVPVRFACGAVERLGGVGDRPALAALEGSCG